MSKFFISPKNPSIRPDFNEAADILDRQTKVMDILFGTGFFVEASDAAVPQLEKVLPDWKISPGWPKLRDY